MQGARVYIYLKSYHLNPRGAVPINPNKYEAYRYKRKEVNKMCRQSSHSNRFSEIIIITILFHNIEKGYIVLIHIKKILTA